MDLDCEGCVQRRAVVEATDVEMGLQPVEDSRIGSIPKTVLRSLVAENDRVYVTLGYGDAVSILDAATGRELMICAETKGQFGESAAGRGTAWRTKVEQQVVAIDTQSRKTAVGKPRAKSAALAGRPRRSRALSRSADRRLPLGALADGKPRSQVPQRLPVRAGRSPGSRHLVGRKGNRAISAEDRQKPLDRGRERGARDQVLFVANELLWTMAGNEWWGADLHTGGCTKIDATEVFDAGHHHRCYPPKATEIFLITPESGSGNHQPYRQRTITENETGFAGMHVWDLALQRLAVCSAAPVLLLPRGKAHRLQRAGPGARKSRSKWKEEAHGWAGQLRGPVIRAGNSSWRHVAPNLSNPQSPVPNPATG